MDQILSISEVNTYIGKAEPFINAVRLKVEKGLVKVDNKDRTLSNIDLIIERLRTWAISGRAQAGMEYNHPNGWNGWIVNVNTLIEGANAQADIGTSGTFFPLLSKTIKDIPKNLPKDLKNAGEIVGGGVSALAGGILGKAWWVLLLAGAGFVGVLWFKKKML